MASMELHRQFLSALKQALRPALGCTEPLTVALAAAHARHWSEATTEPLRFEVEVSANLYKNAAGVYVPGSGMTGLPIAAAMGWFGGDALKSLEVLADCRSEAIVAAQKFVAADRVMVGYRQHADLFYTRLRAIFADEECEVEMGGRHDGLLRVSRNGECCYQMSNLQAQKQDTRQAQQWSIAAIVEFCQSCELAAFDFVLESATLNSALADAGLNRPYGLSVGHNLALQLERGWLSDDLVTQAMILSSAASDARMAGAPLAAMSNSGSGNQGIAATMPVVAVAKRLQVSDEQLHRALVMSHLIAIYVKRLQTPLSALCAATTAAMGSAAAINWLLGGDETQISQAIRYMIGDISGIYCDGAKPGCALKLSTAAASAVKAALLALSGESPRSDGVLEQSVDASLAHLGELTHQALQPTDQLIVQWIAQRKQF